MDKISYALGIGIGRQLAQMGASKLNIDDFAQAIKDVISAADLKVSDQEAQELVQNFFAEQEAKQRAEAEGLVFIPPYDDELVIAGQGTIANELLRQWRDVEYVFVAVGGGGLIAGVAAYLGEVAPHVKVVGVEYEESACLKAALESNERVILPHVGLFADGTAVAQIGELPFEMIRLMKSDNSGPIVEPVIVTVDTDEICAAIKDTYDENRCIVEPSGAMALAGIKK